MELDCAKCSENQKLFYGCEEDSVIPDKWQIKEWVFQRCPIKLITQETQQYIQAYNLLQLGAWPYAQGWFRNSNKFVEAVSIIDSEIKRLEAKAMKQKP